MDNLLSLHPRLFLTGMLSISITASYAYSRIWRQKAESIGYRNNLLYHGYHTRGRLQYLCDLCREPICTDDRYFCLECDVDSQSFDICLKCYEEKGHEHPVKLGKAWKVFKSNITCCAERVDNLFQYYEDQKFLGVREQLGLDEKGKLIYGDYKWLTYREVYEMVKAFSSSLKTLYPKGSYIGICGKNCVQWYVADFALIVGGYVSVPIHFNFDADASQHVVNQANLPTMIVTPEEASKYIDGFKAKKCPSLDSIILMRPDEKIVDECHKIGLKVYLFDELVEKGTDIPYQVEFRKPIEVSSLTYTSGSTGLPKGTIVLDAQLEREFSLPSSTGNILVSLSFGPLAHGTQRKNSQRMFGNGGRIGIYNGDMDRILEDVKVLKPTMLLFPPRFYNQIYNQFNQDLQLKKLANPEANEKTLDDELRKEYRDSFGNRLWNITTGGAHTNPEVIEFLKKTFRCSVDESYGTTETGPISSNGTKNQDIDIKLKDVPELGYFGTDKPNPRGELWIKSKFASPGYFKDEENTKKNFEGSWVSTGDIVEFNEKTNQITIIDRKKNIFKLAQSEFVAPEKLEIIFIRSPMVKNCFIYGTSAREYVLAVIVPDEKALRDWIEYEKLNELKLLSIEELCKHPLVYDEILKSIIKEGEGKLRPYEIPRAIYLEPIPFSPENNLLTASFKLSRMSLVAHYRTILENMYDDLDKNDKVNRTRQVLMQLFSEHIGENAVLDGNSSVTAIGIDSLSAVKLVTSVKKELKLDLPVGLIFDENMTIEKLLQYLAGKGDVQQQKIDWDKETSITEDIQNHFKNAKPYQERQQKEILLTGATGFLGAFLLRELLYNTTANIYCLVRANEETPEKRLKDALLFYELDLSKYESRIKAIKGDLSEPQLGLTPEQFDSFANSLDSIYHCGAEVNSILPYGKMRGANVTSVLDIILLAAKHYVKPIYYVSTISVLGGLDLGSKPDENAKFTKSMLSMMNSYGSSKLVAEMLLQNASQLGIPVVITRPGTISGDTEIGASNPTQFINRIIQSIVILKKAPNLDNTHDMAPVNYVAKAIVHLSNPQNFGKAYHLINYSKSLPLPSLVDGLHASGYSNIEYVPFAQWIQEVKGLAERQKEFLPLYSYLVHGFPSKSKVFDDATQIELLKANIVCPQIDKRILQNYLKFYERKGIIPSV